MREPSTPKSPSFSALVQSFFTEYLATQRAVSPRTVACYRDGLTLFLGFAERQLGRPPTAVRLTDIEPDLILAFLDHLERADEALRAPDARLPHP
jgi:site-specific recombinase XerD